MAATVLLIIQKCLLPGTDVHTDDRLYTNQLGNPNRVLVYTHNSVDPRTSVHTQEAECSWSQLKPTVGQKKRKGIRKDGRKKSIWTKEYGDNGREKVIMSL